MCFFISKVAVAFLFVLYSKKRSETKKMIIAIDGTASSGKTSISKELSSCLGFPLVPTGLIYRAVTLKAQNQNISPAQDDKLKNMIESTKIDLKHHDKEVEVYLDDILIAYEDLRSEKISNEVAFYSVKPFIREFVRKVQRQTAEKFKDIVVEGRDIGSVVFPDADFKFFVDADFEVRANRRLQEYLRNGENVTLEEVKKKLQARDNLDETREISPLVMTSDSILVDTSGVTVEQTVEKMIRQISRI